jgi:hypothetical protein|tara:strand:+ start:1077 stop:2051 length:975 start_codon:yes stop_codon:yes gene_type:complete
MFDILTIAPGKKKTTQSGWTSFNAPCCIHNGHSLDKRGRGGIKTDGDDWSYHCFNCNFKCGFKLGRNISKNCRKFLGWCGMDDSDINKWSLHSLQHKDLLDSIITKKKQHVVPKFKEVEMPEGELIYAVNPQHKVYIDYLATRGLTHNDYPFLVTPNEEGRNSQRLIVPYTYENKIVGSTSRYLDGRIPKFINDQQPGYVFGIDLQKSDWEVCLVFEGIFDAISMNGCALTHNTINDDQVGVLKKLGKRIIVVPDQDKAGLEICDRALELGFDVSLPNWADDVKDANDAMVKYGRLPTLLSILECATSSKIKIEMMRNKIAKRI